jgi:aspartate aminotransferase-like enzyme
MLPWMIFASTAPPDPGTIIPTTETYGGQSRLFTPGPVPIPGHLRALGSQQPQYCRTPEFSRLTLEILEGLGYVFQTAGPVVILTGSGTAAMEAVALNFLCQDDKALIVNAGTFGQRWCDLCAVHGISHGALRLEAGEDLDLDSLASALSENVTVLFVTAHETSTGALFDIEAIGRITRELGVFLVVDAISSVCADRFSMDDWHVDVAVLSSQKGLALPPGLAFIAMGDRALSRLEDIQPRTLYLNVREYLTNQRRGQMPFTPAIGLFLQLHQRLLDIKEMTLDHLIRQHRAKACEFREALTTLPFGTLPARPSNALTAVTCDGFDAYEIVRALRTEHAVEVAPNGGDLKGRVFRVSHMGEHHPEDFQALVEALEDVTARLSLHAESAARGEA